MLLRTNKKKKKRLAIEMHKKSRANETRTDVKGGAMYDVNNYNTISNLNKYNDSRRFIKRHKLLRLTYFELINDQSM